MKLYQILFPMVAPILLLQGRQLKKNMPRLPEASGARVGDGGDGREIRLLVIGDSAAAGVGVSCQSDALSGQLAHALSKRYSAHWTLQAKSGADIKSCLTYQKKQENQSYDIILVSIGVNDVTGRTTPSQWIASLTSLVSLLNNKYQPKRIIFTKIPPMEQFSALMQPMRWFLGAKAQHFNLLLAQYVASQNNCQLLSIEGNLSVNDMASDGFHPGPAIYQHWGQQASAAIEHYYEESAV